VHTRHSAEWYKIIADLQGKKVIILHHQISEVSCKLSFDVRLAKVTGCIWISLTSISSWIATINNNWSVHFPHTRTHTHTHTHTHTQNTNVTCNAAQPLAVPCALNYSLLFSLPLSSGHVINGVTFFCYDSLLGSEGGRGRGYVVRKVQEPNF
jgi:hypothetical protein